MKAAAIFVGFVLAWVLMVASIAGVLQVFPGETGATVWLGIVLALAGAVAIVRWADRPKYPEDWYE